MEQMRAWYDDVQTEPSSSAEFWSLCQRRQDYREVYQQYWMSSRERTIQKRVVDGVIMPAAPSAAVQEGLFSYFGKEHSTQRSPFRLIYTDILWHQAYSGIVNFLDYTAVTFPVTFADRSLDLENPQYEPLNRIDEAVWRTCKYTTVPSINLDHQNKNQLIRVNWNRSKGLV